MTREDAFEKVVANTDDPVPGIAAEYRSWAFEHPHLYALMNDQPLPRGELPEGSEERAVIPLLEAFAGEQPQLVETVRSGQLDHAMPTQEAATRFEEERTEAAKKTVWASGCNSWYLDDRGIPAAWPFPFSRFCAEMSEPKFEDFAAA